MALPGEGRAFHLGAQVQESRNENPDTGINQDGT